MIDVENKMNPAPSLDDDKAGIQVCIVAGASSGQEPTFVEGP